MVFLLHYRLGFICPLVGIFTSSFSSGSLLATQLLAQTTPTNSIELVCCLLVCLYLWLFSISVTKLPSYVLPLIPAAAILVALVWSEALSNYKVELDWGLLVSIALNLLLTIALAIAFWFSPEFIGKDPVIPNLGEKVARANLHWRGVLVWGTISLASIGCLLLRKWRWLMLVNLVGFLAFISLVLQPSYTFVDRLRQMPLRQLAQTITEVRQPTEELWMLGFKNPAWFFILEIRYVS